MKLNNYLLSAFVGVAAFAATAQAQTTTFNFTGGIQTFTVPCGVDTVFVQTWGAQGGSGANGASTSTLTQVGGAGGLGGYAEGWLLVNPGDVLNIFVGGQGATPTGGFNGGANGGSQNAGGGGGASDVRVGGTAEADRVITAGGGGGGGRGGCESSLGAGGVGGNGGNAVGVGGNGQNSPTSGGDAGGGFGGNFGSVQGASGAAGVGCGGFLGAPGTAGSGGTGGVGGAGQSCCCFSAGSIPAGGGGGGGQLGGGGGGGGSAGTSGCSGNDKGAGGGGGGGSSYVGGVLNGVTNDGIWLGNGQVSISWADPIPAATNITGTTMSMCAGADTLSFSTPSDPLATFYTWTVDSALDFISGQNTNTIMVSGSTPGTYMITAVAVNGTCSFTGPADTIMVTIYANPTVTFSVQSIACLSDGAVALSGAPAGGTFSGTAVTGSNFDPSSAGTGNYAITYMYTDSMGCMGSAVDSIMVDPCLGVSSVQMDAFSVSPNPAVEIVNISWNANATVTSIKVMDVTGRVVMTETAINGTTKQLNVAALPAGTYTVALEGSVKTVQTFVKQ